MQKPILLTKRKFAQDVTEVKPVIIMGKDAANLVDWEDDLPKWRRIYGISQYLKVKEM